MWCATQWKIQHLCSSQILLCHWVLVAQHSVASSSRVSCLMKNDKSGELMKCKGWVWLDTHLHILHGSIRPLKIGPLHRLKMMGTQHSVIQHNMPEEWRSQLHCLEGMKTWIKDEQLPKPAVYMKMNRRRVKQEKKRRKQKDHMNTVLSEKRGEKQVETEYLWEKKYKWEQQCDKSAALDIQGKTKKGIHKGSICS